MTITKVLAAVQEVAKELGVTPAQVALAWTRAHSRAIHPLVGASSTEQLADNLAAIELDLPGGGRSSDWSPPPTSSSAFPRDFIPPDLFAPDLVDGR